MSLVVYKGVGCILQGERAGQRTEGKMLFKKGGRVKKEARKRGKSGLVSWDQRTVPQTRNWSMSLVSLCDCGGKDRKGQSLSEYH